jgi:hypothetical protein
MMHGEKTLVCVAGAFVLCAAASAMAIESSGTPYQEIVVRNVFGLTNPPPPGPPPDTKPPPPKITLNGIITMQGKKRALMKVLMPVKPGAKQEEQSFILAVGQRDSDIEVLEIDEKAGVWWVKVNEFGTITNLSFENNGVKLASGPPPGMPGVGGPPPGMPGVGGPPNAGQRTIPIPGRPVRFNPGGAAAAPTSSGGMPTYTANGSAPGSVTPGTMALGGAGASASAPRSQNWPPETVMSPEHAAISEAAYALRYQKEISRGQMPPPPPGNPLVDGGNTSPRSY